MLPLAQFTYNNIISLTTQQTLFYTNYRYHPRLFMQQGSTIENEDVQIQVENISKLHLQMSRDIEFFSHRMALYYNGKRQMGPDFEKGEKVYLLRRNIKTKRPSTKLDHQKLGPFEIEEQLGPVGYKLKLPKSMKIHPNFHVSLLEKAPDDAETPDNVELDENTTEEEYEVERILQMKKFSGRTKYLVKWKGYDTSENTWEPVKNLTSCRAAVQQFHQEQKEKQKVRFEQESYLTSSQTGD